MFKINIGKDFSKNPNGRYSKNGYNSGEEFRESILLPLLKKGTVEINFNGTLGYSSCFLEEAFGGLMRNNKINILSYNTIINRLIIVSDDPSIKIEILEYIKKAKYKRQTK